MNSNVSFIVGLYLGLLDRMPDPDGLKNWVAALDSGATTREHVVTSFFNSAEFQARSNSADLHEIVRRATALLEGAANERQVMFVVTHQNPVETAVCDADRISQVVINLLTNALRVSPANSRIEITTGHDATHVWCRIRDFGAGIDAQHLPHIFERFYRVDPSRTRATGGAGVGLTIARAIAEAHGGTLTASSDGLGTGATFVLALPRS